MGCYHPLKGFYVGSWSYSDDEGKKHKKNEAKEHTKKALKIVPYAVDGKEVQRIGYIGDRYYLDTDVVCKSHYDEVFDFWYTIPCGQCIGCRLDYSRQWANRLMMELTDHDPADCWFLTLTYDNSPRSLERILSSNKETGEATLTLNKRDVQLFNKRLRKEFDSKKIRFFLAGEYGENTLRPHYHGIYFSLHLDGFDPEDESNVWCRTNQGFTLYHWPRLDEIWSYGRVILAPVSWDTCAYTARYVCKKLTGEAAEYYENFGLVPEFSLMSRKPGIARNYFERMEDFEPDQKISLATDRKGLTFSPPRYFKDLWKLDNSLESDIISFVNVDKALERKRQIQEQNALAKEDWLAYLNSVEQSHIKGASKLDRSAV